MAIAPRAGLGQDQGLGLRLHPSREAFLETAFCLPLELSGGSCRPAAAGRCGPAAVLALAGAPGPEASAR